LAQTSYAIFLLYVYIVITNLCDTL